MSGNGPVLVLICAGAEWRAALPHLPEGASGVTPYGPWRADADPVGSAGIVFTHTGWGKIAAAAAAQHAIDRWKPRLVINIGTCGGFAGVVERGEIVMAERTVVYDIIELMGDREEALAHYAVELDTAGWRDAIPGPLRRAPMVSADRDLHIEEIDWLRERFDAVAADWESGALAWVARRNELPILILRGVSDLVGPDGGEAYGAPGLFADRCGAIMRELLRRIERATGAE